MGKVLYHRYELTQSGILMIPPLYLLYRVVVVKPQFMQTNEVVLMFARFLSMLR